MFTPETTASQLAATHLQRLTGKYQVRPLVDDSEAITLSRASQLAKHSGPLVLSLMASIPVEVAHALKGHRGQELVLPSVTLLPKEVACVLAEYPGLLRIDRLWLLNSVPLFRKLQGQWSAETPPSVFPNLSVEVAESAEFWPPPSERWPPEHTEPEITKAEMLTWRLKLLRERMDSNDNALSQERLPSVLPERLAYYKEYSDYCYERAKKIDKRIDAFRKSITDTFGIKLLVRRMPRRSDKNDPANG